MNKIKKLLSVLITVVLSLTMINNVSAESNGSIVVNGTTAGKTYEIYKIFDLTYSGTKVAYTIDSDWNAFFTEEEGKNYIISKDKDGNILNNANEVIDDINNSEDDKNIDFSKLNPITIGNETKYINITGDNIETFTQEALAYAVGVTADGSETASSTSLTFSNLALGYYLVYPQGATNILEGNGTICSITSTVPNATVNIKATYPTIDKTIEEGDENAEVGELVDFTITGLVPDTTGYKTYTYEINDTMTDGLQISKDTADLEVKFGTEIIDVTPVYGENGFTLTFDMTDYQDYVGKTITVTYKVLVTEAAVNSDTTKNSATLTYSNNPKTNSTFTTPEIEVYVYSSEIKVIKVDADDNTVTLAGASFYVKNAQGLYYQAKDAEGNIITNTTSTSNVVDVNWVADKKDATLLVTEEDGIVTFEGVENGTYYLVEEDAPEGYNKLAKPVTVKVGYADAEGTNLGEVGVSHEEIVENNSGTTLPQTGGFGTKLFIVIGSLLAVLSAILLITNKRIAKEY